MTCSDILVVLAPLHAGVALILCGTAFLAERQVVQIESELAVLIGQVQMKCNWTENCAIF